MPSRNRSFAIILRFLSHFFSAVIVPSSIFFLFPFPSLPSPISTFPCISPPPPLICHLALSVKVFIHHPNNYPHVFLCSFRWSFGVLTWEIITFGRWFYFILFFCHLKIFLRKSNLSEISSGGTRKDARSPRRPTLPLFQLLPRLTKMFPPLAKLFLVPFLSTHFIAIP